MKTTHERFLAKVSKTQTCWLWTASMSPAGYGWFKCAGNTWAHRYSWEAYNGASVPPGMVVRHLCNNPSCVNPLHLHIGTHADNKHDSVVLSRHSHHERHNKTKLSYQQAHEVRTAVLFGAKQRDIARLFGVERESVGQVIRGESWVSRV